MPPIHTRHTRKLELALKEGVVLDLHVVNDLDLHSVEIYNNDIVREYDFGSYIN